MTEEKKSEQPIRHLLPEDIATIYKVLFRRFQEIGEPIPPFEQVNKSQIEKLSALPQMCFSGKELYPTLESKAALIFYTINKGHIFPNGNKRMSLACLFVFLASNGIELSITQDEATSKALELSQTEAHRFEEVKSELENWIREHMTPAGETRKVMFGEELQTQKKRL